MSKKFVDLANLKSNLENFLSEIITPTFATKEGVSEQLGSHTVKSDVPENAVFTDTVYDYSALLGYDIYNLVSLKDATYPANKAWLSKDFIAPFDGYIFFMVQTDATSGAFSQVFKEDDVLISDNQKMIADFNTWGCAYNYKIFKGKTYHFGSYTNTATAFNKVMLCIRKKFEIPTEYVPYAPSNVGLAEETTNLDNRISDNGYGEVAGGKNLAIVYSFSTPNNEIIFTKKDDSTLIANGSNYNAGAGLTKSFLAKAGITYTAQIITDLQLNMFIWNSDEGSSVTSLTGDKKISFSVTKDTNISVAIDANNVIFNNTEIKIQIEEGSQATEYEPYFPSNKMLAEENSQQSTEMMDIKMLGWSVPKECPIQNEVNGNQFIQKVGRADMSKLAWYTYSSTGIFRFASEIGAGYTKYNIKRGSSAYSRGYNYVGTSGSWSDISNYGNKTIMGVWASGSDDGFILTNNAYTNSSDFKQAMQGQYLYYELATYNTMAIDGNEEVVEVAEDVNTLKKETTVNLLNPTLQTTTQNGVTCTNNGDGTYILNGIATKTVALKLATVSLKANKNYKLIAQSPTDASTNVKVHDKFGMAFGDGTYKGATPIITPTRDLVSIVMLIEIATNTSLNNFIVKPMLTTNLNATYDDFVPYTGDTGKLNSDVASLLKRIETLESLVNKTDTTTTE